MTLFNISNTFQIVFKSSIAKISWLGENIASTMVSQANTEEQPVFERTKGCRYGVLVLFGNATSPRIGQTSCFELITFSFQFVAIFTIITAAFDIYCLAMAAPGSTHYGYYFISYEFVYVGNRYGECKTS